MVLVARVFSEFLQVTPEAISLPRGDGIFVLWEPAIKGRTIRIRVNAGRSTMKDGIVTPAEEKKQLMGSPPLQSNLYPESQSL